MYKRKELIINVDYLETKNNIEEPKPFYANKKQYSEKELNIFKAYLKSVRLNHCPTNEIYRQLECVDINQNRFLDNDEIPFLEYLIKDPEGKMPLHHACTNPQKTKEILDAVENNEILTEKLLLEKDLFGRTPLHYTNSEVTKVILDKIKNKKELLKKCILSETNIGFTPLHTFDSNKIRLILENISDDKELLREALLSRDLFGRTILHFAKNSEITEIILDKVADDKNLQEKLLFDKCDFKHTVFYKATSQKVGVILDKIKNNKELLKKIFLEKDINGRTLLQNISLSLNEKDIFGAYIRTHEILKTLRTIFEKIDDKQLLEKILTKDVYNSVNEDCKKILKEYAQKYGIEL